MVFCAISAKLPVGFAEKRLARELDPTDMVQTPDGRIFITIKSGKILLFEKGALLPGSLLNIEHLVDNYNERGLGHIVLDPDFDLNGYFYLYYTVKGQNFNRVSRYTASGNFCNPATEQVILDLEVMAGSVHNAGEMVFGGDGKLYIAVGDGANTSNSQSLNSLLGKVLRINKDGSIPTDNPFYNQTSGKYRTIWALGLRNPFSMDVQPSTKKIFVCDVGFNKWEEINELGKGLNFGWPGIEGKRTNQQIPTTGIYKDPIYTYPHGEGVTKGCAIVGASFYEPSPAVFPPEYSGKFYFADYCNGYISYIDPVTYIVNVFATEIDRPLALITSADGKMYYLARGGLGGGSEQDNTVSNTGELWEISYTGSGAPFFSSMPSSVLVSVGEAATFKVTANGALPLTYQWRVNGLDMPSDNTAQFQFPPTTIADHGKVIDCVVKNSFGSITSEPAVLSVTNNRRPIPVINWNLPGNAEKYKAGQLLSFKGIATDPDDGPLNESTLTWKIDFHHEQHTHPALPSTQGIIMSGNFIIPEAGETSTDVWYRIILSAVDQGDPPLTGTTHEDVFPWIVTHQVESIPSGATIFLDGQPFTTPFSFEGVVNTIRNLEAEPDFTDAENYYRFEKWEETNSPFVAFYTPETEKTYRAYYTALPFGLYPSIVTHTLNVASPDATQISWQIVNSLGKEIRAGVSDRGDFEVNVSDVAAGVYFIKLSSGFTGRFIKY